MIQPLPIGLKLAHLGYQNEKREMLPPVLVSLEMAKKSDN
jgi:hypothetical protein